jgi:hypothetical protein
VNERGWVTASFDLVRTNLSCISPDAVARRADVVHVTANLVAGSHNQGCKMDELNGRMLACQILLTGLIAKVANNTPDPLRFLSTD